jgi:hypothetical protein
VLNFHCFFDLLRHLGWQRDRNGLACSHRNRSYYLVLPDLFSIAERMPLSSRALAWLEWGNPTSRVALTLGSRLL